MRLPVLRGVRVSAGVYLTPRGQYVSATLYIVITKPPADTRTPRRKKPRAHDKGGITLNP